MATKIFTEGTAMRCVAILMLAGSLSFAATAVRGSEPPNELLKLWEATRSSDAKVRSEAIGNLAEQGASTVPLLMEIWNRGDSADAFAVAQALRKLKPTSPQVVAILCKSLSSHKDKAISAHAARALGSLGGEGETIPTLVAGLKDTETDVVEACVYSLTELGPKAKAACPELAALATRVIVEKKAEVGASELFTAAHAVNALARIDPTGNKDLILRLSGELIRLRAKHRMGWSGAAVEVGAVALENMDCCFKEASALLAEYIDDPAVPDVWRERAVQAAKTLLDRRLKRKDK